LDCTVKEVTRVTEKTSTLIGKILIDVNRVKAKKKVFETDLSEHKAQEIVFKEFYVKTKKNPTFCNEFTLRKILKLLNHFYQTKTVLP